MSLTRFPAAIDIEVGSTTPEQMAIAVGGIALAFALLLIALYRNRYAGLTGTARETVASLTGQLATQQPGSVRIDEDDDLEERRDDVSRAFESAGAVEEIASARDAATSVRSAVATAWEPVTELVPKFGRRLLLLAILTVVGGAVAVNHEAIVRALTADPSPPDLVLWLQLAVTQTLASLQTVLSVIGRLPLIGAVVTLVWSIGIIVGQWIYPRWWVLAVVLVALAARLIYYRHRGVPAPGFELPDPERSALRVAGGVGVTWGATAISIGIGRSVGTPDDGVSAGAITLGIVGLLVAGVAISRFRRSVRSVRMAWVDAAADSERGRLLVHLTGLAAAVAVAPFVPVWLVVAATNAPAVASAWVQASLGIQLLSVVLVAGAVVSTAYLLRDAADDVGEALREHASRNGLRMWVGARGAPVGVMGFVFLLATGFGSGIVLGGLLAAAVGLVVRGLFALAERARHRTSMLGSDPPGARRAIVHAYQLTDPDGRDHYIARVNGHQLAHNDREAAVDAILQAAADCFEDGRPSPSVASAHATHLLEDGITDVDETRDRLRSQVRRTIDGRLSREGAVDRDELRSDLSEDFPREVWESVWSQARRHRRFDERGARVLARATR